MAGQTRWLHELNQSLAGRSGQLEDMLAALDAATDVRVPHEVALDIMREEESHPSISKSPRHHAEIPVREKGIAAGYISEVESGPKPVSISALARFARTLGTTIDVLMNVSIP